jgi:hypothetical protein
MASERCAHIAAAKGQLGSGDTEERTFETAAVKILLMLWALGLVTSYTMGGLIHVLIVAAIVLVVVRLMQGQRA